MTVPATLRKIGKHMILIMTIQTNKTVLLTTYSHIEVVGYLNKESLMRMENTGYSGRFLKFNPPDHKDRRDSEYNVQMLWETGEVTFKPLDFLAKDIPVKLAQYVIENSLLNKPV